MDNACCLLDSTSGRWHSEHFARDLEGFEAGLHSKAGKNQDTKGWKVAWTVAYFCASGGFTHWSRLAGNWNGFDKVGKFSFSQRLFGASSQRRLGWLLSQVGGATSFGQPDAYGPREAGFTQVSRWSLENKHGHVAT